MDSERPEAAKSIEAHGLVEVSGEAADATLVANAEQPLRMRLALRRSEAPPFEGLQVVRPCP